MSRDTRYQSNLVAQTFSDTVASVRIRPVKDKQDQKVHQQYHELTRVCLLVYWTAAISDKVFFVLTLFAVSTCVLSNISFNNVDHVASNVRRICES